MKKSTFFGIFALSALIVLSISYALMLGQHRGGPMMLSHNSTGSSMSTSDQLNTLSVEGLPEAKPTEEVRLNNGDTYTLTAAPVKKTINGKGLRLLAYNGMLPGPRLHVQQGSEITVNFINNTDVETTIHPHGVRVDNAFDGVVDVTQKTVKPGETFSYKLRFPDAGIFWYHPHVRDDYQQESGLYANFYVESPDPSYLSPVNAEQFLFLDDIKLSEAGLAPFSKVFTNFSLMGRFGDTLMINWDTSYTLSAKKGEVTRLYFTNSANTRTFNLSIPGAKMKLVGSDGGRYEHETFVDSVLIAPSERYIVDVYFPSSGTFLMLQTTPSKSSTMGDVRVAESAVEPSYAKEFGILRTNDDIVKEMDTLRGFFTRSPDKELVLGLDMGMQSMDHGMMMDTPTKIEWEDTMVSMNQMSTSQNTTWKITDKQTGASNMDIRWNFQQGDKIKIRINNDRNSMHPMQHPFHMHGQRFVVLGTNGIANDNLVWKDSVLIQAGDTVDILVDMSNPGIWMAHCHIAEHLHSGMMFGFVVNEKP